MSELIHERRVELRWRLLTSASALVLSGYFASANLAKAEDRDRPTIWIELGGQLESMQGLSGPFTAPFMSAVTPTPDVYKGVSFADAQHLPRLALDAEGKIVLQPKNSDWVFSASVRYGRSRSKQHIHNQTKGLPEAFFTYSGAPYATVTLSRAEFLDISAPSSEHHTIVDFNVGRDIGIGFLGQGGSSNLNAGVRLVDFASTSSATIYARPNINIFYPPPKYTLPQEEWNAYTMMAHASRSFRGVGPSVSWNASAALMGNEQDGELMVDWSVNAALLFGRQNAKTDHRTMATHYLSSAYRGALYPSRSRDNPLRSRQVAIPNIGGSAGLSVKYPNFKFSFGYRYDAFFNAMDTGIDARKTSNLTFQGPYASVSIGLGG